MLGPAANSASVSATAARAAGIRDVAIGVGEHDLAAHATLRREAIFEQVDSPLGFRAGNREIVAGLTTNGGIETDDRDPRAPARPQPYR